MGLVLVLEIQEDGRGGIKNRGRISKRPTTTDKKNPKPHKTRNKGFLLALQRDFVRTRKQESIEGEMGGEDYRDGRKGGGGGGKVGVGTFPLEGCGGFIPKLKRAR